MIRATWTETVVMLRELGESLARPELDQALLARADEMLANVQAQSALHRAIGGSLGWLVRDLQSNFVPDSPVLNDPRAPHFLRGLGCGIRVLVRAFAGKHTPGEDLKMTMELVSVYILGLEELELAPQSGEDAMPTPAFR